MTRPKRSRGSISSACLEAKAGASPSSLPDLVAAQAVTEGILLPEALSIDCAVLDDGRRVLTARGPQQVFAAAKGGKMGRNLEKLRPYLAADSLRPSEFVPMGGAAHAYDAKTLVDICKAYSRAHLLVCRLAQPF